MIGKIISERRKELGITITEISDFLNVPQQNIYKWENEAYIPAIDYLIPICEILKLDISTLQASTSAMEYSFLFSKRIKEYRQQENLSLDNLSNQIGVSRQTISKWERGQSLPNIDLFYEMCESLDVSAESFFLEGEFKKKSSMIVEEKPRFFTDKRVYKGMALLSLFTLFFLMGFLIAFAIASKKPIDVNYYEISGTEPTKEEEYTIANQENVLSVDCSGWNIMSTQILEDHKTNYYSIPNERRASFNSGIGYQNGNPLTRYEIPLHTYGDKIQITLIVDDGQREYYYVKNGSQGFSYSMNGLSPNVYYVDYTIAYSSLNGYFFTKNTVIQIRSFNIQSKTIEFYQEGNLIDTCTIDLNHSLQYPSLDTNKYLWGYEKKGNKYTAVLSDTPIEVTLIDGDSVLSYTGAFDLTKINDLPHPKKNGYICTGYTYNNELVTEDTLFLNQSVVLYTHYEKICKITFSNYIDPIESYVGENIMLPFYMNTSGYVDHYTYKGICLSNYITVTEDMNLEAVYISFTTLNDVFLTTVAFTYEIPTKVIIWGIDEAYDIHTVYLPSAFSVRLKNSDEYFTVPCELRGVPERTTRLFYGHMSGDWMINSVFMNSNIEEFYDFKSDYSSSTFFMNQIKLHYYGGYGGFVNNYLMKNCHIELMEIWRNESTNDIYFSNNYIEHLYYFKWFDVSVLEDNNEIDHMNSHEFPIYS